MSESAVKYATILADLEYFGENCIPVVAKAIDEAADEKYRPLVEAVESMAELKAENYHLQTAYNAMFLAAADTGRENTRLRAALEAAPQPNNDLWVATIERPNRTNFDKLNRQYCQWYGQSGPRTEALKARNVDEPNGS